MSLTCWQGLQRVQVPPRLHDPDEHSALELPVDNGQLEFECVNLGPQASSVHADIPYRSAQLANLHDTGAKPGNELGDGRGNSDDRDGIHGGDSTGGRVGVEVE